MKKLFFTIGVISSVFLISCDDSASKDQKTIDKHGSVEMKISQIHLKDSMIIKFDKVFYDNNGKMIKHLISNDTIKTLGLVNDTIQISDEGEDDNGNYIPAKYKIIKHNKDYKFYITLTK